MRRNNLGEPRVTGNFPLMEVLPAPTPEGSRRLRELRPGLSESYYTWLQLVNELFGVIY